MKKPSLRSLVAVGTAAVDAAEPIIEQRVAQAIQDERMSVNITIATRERSAYVEGLSRAVLACQKVARQKRRERRLHESHGAHDCVEAVRALLPEVA